MAQIWKLNGKYEILNTEQFGEFTNSTLDEISKRLPGGAYTTFRTYEHFKAVSIENHIQRLEETAALAGKPVSIDHQKLRNTIREILNHELTPELRIRITVDLVDQPGLIYLTYEPLITPAKDLYKTGVETITANFERKNPKAKLTKFISDSQSLKTLIHENLNEILMVNGNGDILEGLTSNFYGVIESKIYTADEGVLLGITREALLDEAKKFGFEVVFRPVNLREIENLEEAFLTSSSRNVLPIRKINQTTIGNGTPGVVTNKLMELMKKRIISEYEII